MSRKTKVPGPIDVDVDSEGSSAEVITVYAMDLPTKPKAVVIYINEECARLDVHAIDALREAILLQYLASAGLESVELHVLAPGARFEHKGAEYILLNYEQNPAPGDYLCVFNTQSRGVETLRKDTLVHPIQT